VFVKFFGALFFKSVFVNHLCLTNQFRICCSRSARAVHAARTLVGCADARGALSRDDFGSKSHLAECAFCAAILSRRLFVLNELE
jgi:hypothetical protein